MTAKIQVEYAITKGTGKGRATDGKCEFSVLSLDDMQDLALKVTEKNSPGARIGSSCWQIQVQLNSKGGERHSQTTQSQDCVEISKPDSDLSSAPVLKVKRVVIELL